MTTGKIANGAITTAKLSSEVAPLLGALKSGQTLRGVFELGTEASGAGDFVSNGVSFFFPLSSAPATSVLEPGSSSAGCPGVGGGQTPNAAPNNLCVYIASRSGAAGSLTIENTSRLGFGLKAEASGAGAYGITGLWAVTAP